MISTNDAPKAIGPYSQAVRKGNFLFISGQLPVNPVTGEMEEDCFKKQTDRCMKNIAGVLKQCGLDFTNIAKTTIYIKDMNKFADVNEVYGEYFEEYKPARACIEVSKLPKDALVEIEAIAVFDN